VGRGIALDQLRLHLHHHNCAKVIALKKEGRFQAGLSLVVVITAGLAYVLMYLAAGRVPERPKILPAAQAKVAKGISLAALDSTWQSAQLCDLYSWSSAALDRPVRLKGRLHTCSGSEEWLPAAESPMQGQIVLYRYVNSCCSGHAMPAVVELVELSAGQTGNLPQDAWVELTGRYIPAAAPGAMPGIRVETLSPAPELPAQAMEQMFPPSIMAGKCQGSRPEMAYPPR
jgi:hypothetical protein